MRIIEICEALKKQGVEIGFEKKFHPNFDGKGPTHTAEINGVGINFCPFCGARIDQWEVPKGEPCKTWIEEYVPADDLGELFE